MLSAVPSAWQRHRLIGPPSGSFSVGSGAQMPGPVGPSQSELDVQSTFAVPIWYFAGQPLNAFGTPKESSEKSLNVDGMQIRTPLPGPPPGRSPAYRHTAGSVAPLTLAYWAQSALFVHVVQ